MSGEEAQARSAGWPSRPALLAITGLFAALVAHFLIGGHFFGDLPAWRTSLASGVVIGAMAFGFVVERDRLIRSIAFGAACGLVAALILFWNGPVNNWGAGEGWRVACMLLAIGIAAPLFQGMEPRDALPWRARYPYAPIHEHAWVNAVLFAASWVFVGIVLAMLWLLASLLDLIGLHFLKDLLTSHYWFWRGVVGLAFGGGLGMLREQGRVVQLLQRVVTSVLGVLAPALAAGLALFLGALPFTGLSALWDTWMSAAGLMLACTVASLLLANAVVGNDRADEARNIVLRVGATVLALVMLPLAVLAAIAIGLRIGQYGLTPDRLWALTFAVIASAFGVAYFVTVLRRRMAWPDAIRPANIRLAMGLCVVALVMATPIVGFNAMATRDQVARLQSGRIAPEKFDWPALRFAFGEPGREAVARLAKSGDVRIRELAAAAQKAESRWDMSSAQGQIAAEKTLDRRTRVLPAGASVPAKLRAQLTDPDLCGDGNRQCTLLLPAPDEAVVLSGPCWKADGSAKQPAPKNKEARSVAAADAAVTVMDCFGPSHLVLRNGDWEQTGGPYQANPMPEDSTAEQKLAKGYAAGDIEIRTVERRQVFVGGVPVGDTFK